MSEKNNISGMQEKILPKLSICIATYNRGDFIAETLDSILSQITPDVEIVVVDGASPDNTSDVMAQYMVRYPEIKYFREEINSGVDKDFDKAVSYATGEYCWLMTDDDLLSKDAISLVLAQAKDDVDLIIADAEVKTSDFSKTLTPKRIDLSSNQKYDNGSRELFFQKTADALSFIGGVIVRREFWLSRNREKYYGTLFIHVGVIFQSPACLKVTVIAKPLIIIRYGNAMWTSRGFEIWMFKWPLLLWSFDDYSDDTKALVCPREPWRSARNLVIHRALGGYGMDEYNRFLADKVDGFSRILPFAIANTPTWLMNALASLYCLMFNRTAIAGMYDISRSSHSTWVSRLVARILKV